MATPRKRGGDPAMEKLMAAALAREQARPRRQPVTLQAVLLDEPAQRGKLAAQVVRIVRFVRDAV